MFTRPAAVGTYGYQLSLINVYKTFYLNNFKCKSPDNYLSYGSHNRQQL